MSRVHCPYTGYACVQNCKPGEVCAIQADYDGEAAYERSRRRLPVVTIVDLRPLLTAAEAREQEGLGPWDRRI